MLPPGTAPGKLGSQRKGVISFQKAEPPVAASCRGHRLSTMNAGKSLNKQTAITTPGGRERGRQNPEPLRYVKCPDSTEYYDTCKETGNRN